MQGYVEGISQVGLNRTFFGNYVQFPSFVLRGNFVLYEPIVGACPLLAINSTATSDI